MTQHRKTQGSGPRTHLFEWVEDKLRPVFVSPPAGAYEAEHATDLQECPICGRSMREHTIDHSVANTILICPVPHPGAWDRDAFEPVNEFGMLSRRRAQDPPRG